MSSSSSNAERTETARSHRRRVPTAERPVIVWTFPQYGQVSAPEGRHIVGRADSCDTTLSGTKISREHAEVLPVAGALSIRDLGSRNGVYVNGRQISDTTALAPGDVLRLGEWIGCVVTSVPEGAARVAFEEIAPGLLCGPTLAALLEPIRRVAKKGMPLVIEGATGTGKERVARAIHTWSGRQGEYLGVNCAAIPGELAEAELFGHSKGAFTGADRARLGFFRQAHGGTLLLDEFLELSPKTQAKLLRVLEEWEVQPIGESRSYKIDVLVLAATQEPLSEVVDAGQLRSDLVARLGVISVRLPRLSERREDIPPLFRHFLGMQGGPVPELDAELVEWLCLQRWTQNIRELEWMARAMMALHDGVPCLTIEHLPPRGRQPASVPAGARESAPYASSQRADPEEEALFTRLVQALDDNGGVVLRAAEAVGITRQKAYRLLQKNDDFELGSVRKRGR